MALLGAYEVRIDKMLGLSGGSWQLGQECGAGKRPG
jgi:hypothetical protein